LALSSPTILLPREQLDTILLQSTVRFVSPTKPRHNRHGAHNVESVGEAARFTVRKVRMQTRRCCSWWTAFDWGFVSAT